jgi:carbon storage regulator
MALVLSRKLNESIMIDKNIEVRVVEVIGSKVKLAIEAPWDVDVHRKEIFLEIQRQEESSGPELLK